MNTRVSTLYDCSNKENTRTMKPILTYEVTLTTCKYNRTTLKDIFTDEEDPLLKYPTARIVRRRLISVSGYCCKDMDFYQNEAISGLSLSAEYGAGRADGQCIYLGDGGRSVSVPMNKFCPWCGHNQQESETTKEAEYEQGGHTSVRI